MKKRIKINGIIIFAAFWLIVAFPNLFLRQGQGLFFDQATRIMGITLIVLGQLIRASARGYKAENSRNSQRLIDSGPYAVVRNPMYLGILLAGLGIVMALFQWWVAWIFLIVFGLRYILLISKEEKKLLAAFPEQYAVYSKEVGRLFPSINKMSRMYVYEYCPLKISWLKKEIGPLIAILVVILALGGWQYIKEGNFSAYLKELLVACALLGLFVYIINYLVKRTNAAAGDTQDEGKDKLQ